MVHLDASDVAQSNPGHDPPIEVLEGWIAGAKSGLATWGEGGGSERSIGNWEGSEKSITGTRHWEGTTGGISWGARSDLSSLSGSGRPASSVTFSDSSSALGGRGTGQDIRSLVIFDKTQPPLDKAQPLTEPSHELVGILTIRYRILSLIP